MLSTKSGDHIANVVKAKKVVKRIYLNDVNKDDNEVNNDDSIIPKSFFTNLRGITPANMLLLRRAIRINNIELIPKAHETMLEAYKQAQILLKELSNKSIIVKPVDGHLQLIPPEKHFALAVYGPSGVGKSYFVSRFIMEYKSKYKKDCDVYVFSAVKNDPAYEDIKPTFINIDDTVITDPFNIGEFGLNKHNLCIFDDIEALGSSHYSAIAKFRDNCLECGRHCNIDIIAIHHVIQGGKDTKKIINECDYSIVFPRCNFSSIQKLLANYYGFSRDDISFVRDLGKRSRAVVVKRSYPSFIMGEQEVRIV